MIGTIEALGVFLLAVLPGYVGLRVYGIGRPPLRPRGGLHDLGLSISWTLATWLLLLIWRGSQPLAVVLDDRHPVALRIDGFVELVWLAVVLGIGFALLARCAGVLLAIYVSRDDPDSLVSAMRRDGFALAMRRRLTSRASKAVTATTVPGGAWDRLLAGLNNEGRTVICRVTTHDGHEVMGVFADRGHADWAADGRDLLLMPEIVRDPSGNLEEVRSSVGVFVAGERIAVVSAVALPDGALRLSSDD